MTSSRDDPDPAGTAEAVRVVVIVAGVLCLSGTVAWFVHLAPWTRETGPLVVAGVELGLATAVNPLSPILAALLLGYGALAVGVGLVGVGAVASWGSAAPFPTLDVDPGLRRRVLAELAIVGTLVALVLGSAVGIGLVDDYRAILFVAFLFQVAFLCECLVLGVRFSAPAAERGGKAGELRAAYDRIHRRIEAATGSSRRLSWAVGLSAGAGTAVWFGLAAGVVLVSRVNRTFPREFVLLFVALAVVGAAAVLTVTALDALATWRAELPKRGRRLRRTLVLAGAVVAVGWGFATSVPLVLVYSGVVGFPGSYWEYLVLLPVPLTPLKAATAGGTLVVVACGWAVLARLARVADRRVAR